MPIEPSSRAGLTMTGKGEVVREIQAPAERAREDRRVNAVKLENLLRDGLVLRIQQPVRARAREPLAEEFEIARDAVVRSVVPGKRLGKIEDQVAVGPRQRVQALGGPVEDVQRGIVTELAQRLGNFILDFFLVEGPRQRGLFRRCAASLFRLLPAIVEDENVQFAHELEEL